MSIDRSEIDNLLADIRQATQRARDTARQNQRDREELARETRQEREQQAEAARRGELGRDWQELQGRIDRGQTTLSQVLSGQDTSPLAQRIRQLTTENLDTLTAEIAEHDEATGGERFSGLNEAFADLRDSVERAAQAAQHARDTNRPQ